MTSSDTVDTEEIVAHLRTHRAAVIRSAVDPAYVRELRAESVAVYKKLDGAMKRGRDADGPTASGHAPITGIPKARALPQALRQVTEAFGDQRGLVFPDSFLLRRIMPLGKTPEFALERIAFHQDEYFTLDSEAAVFGKPTKSERPLMYTLWLPLNACGRDAPGLSFVRGSDYPIVLGIPKEGWERYISDVYGSEALWSPELQEGDVIVFTSRTIHGTHINSDMTKPRFSIEMRGPLTL